MDIAGDLVGDGHQPGTELRQPDPSRRRFGPGVLGRHLHAHTDLAGRLKPGSMSRYVVRRLGLLVAITFVISILTFLLVHLLPGDPTLAILGPNDTPAARAELLRQLGLNKGLLAQYWTWISNVVHGNLGESFITKQTVANALGEAVPIDLELIVLSQVMALGLAIPMALVAARRPNRLFDRIATTTTFGMFSVPTFVVAVVLVLIFAVKLHEVPATGFVRLSQGLGPNLQSAILPSVSLAIGSVAVYFRLLRADLVATLQEDYVTMARSKGLSTRYILLRHALRPSSFSLLAGGGHQHRLVVHRRLRRRGALPAPRHRVPTCRRHPVPGLPHGPGHGARGGRGLRGRQLRRRFPPHRTRPPGATCLSEPSPWPPPTCAISRSAWRG